jgi:predicted SprT family Zn-dependent metalloprotease
LEEGENNENNSGASPNYVKADKGEPSGSHVEVSLNNKPIENNLETSNETILGHELKHSHDYDKGNMKGQTFIPSSHKSEKEIRAVNFENRIRKKQGLTKRTTYGRKKIAKEKLK